MAAQGEKMKFDLGDVLTRMWKIGWNHKVLWLWQILPGLFSVLFMPLMFLSNPAFMMMLPEPFNRFADEAVFSIILMLLMFVFMFLSAFLGALAQLITTYGALKVERGAEKLAFRELFKESLPYFWRVLGLYALFFGMWMVLYSVFMILFMAGSVLTLGLSTFCLTPFFFLLLPVMLIGYSVLELAQASIIADDMGTFHAISRSWKLFRENWLGLSLLMLILYFGLTMLSSIMVFPLMVPMMGLPILIETQIAVSSLMVMAFLVVLTLAMFLMIIVQGILMAFFQSVWAVTYLRLTQGEDTPIQA
jgi:hypothetical protein